MILPDRVEFDWKATDYPQQATMYFVYNESDNCYEFDRCEFYGLQKTYSLTDWHILSIFYNEIIEHLRELNKLCKGEIK